MRSYIPLPVGTTATDWGPRHRRGEVPDSTPYGLHHLRDHGFDVTFGDRDLSGWAARVARSARYRTKGLEMVETWSDVARLSRRSSDVVLAYDERTGVPAALRSSRAGVAPVVTGIGWLTTPDDTPPLQRRIAARALPRAAGVWTQCSAMVPILGEAWGLRDVAYVPLGIDTDFYAAQPWDDVGPTVVSAGEDRFRDHELLVEAVRTLRADVPAARLDLATALPTSHDPDLGVLHTERLGGRMRDLYARSQVVAVALHPTPTGSGLTVVLEAMASGRPIVVTDNPGVRDYVDHGVTGLLVPAEDPDAFAAALRELLLDPQRCREMGTRARQVAEDRFTSAGMSAVLAALLHAAC